MSKSSYGNFIGGGTDSATIFQDDGKRTRNFCSQMRNSNFTLKITLNWVPPTFSSENPRGSGLEARMTKTSPPPADLFFSACSVLWVNLSNLGTKTATTWRCFEAESLRGNNSSHMEIYGKNWTLTCSSEHAEYNDAKVRICFKIIPKNPKIGRI